MRDPVLLDAAPVHAERIEPDPADPAELELVVEFVFQFLVELEFLVQFIVELELQFEFQLQLKPGRQHERQQQSGPAELQRPVGQ